MLLYFETSAINNFAENRSIEDAIATKELQHAKGRRWAISIVTLWEIFLINNENDRDNLFNFSRFLFDEFLVPSPEEIIVNFIKAGCPNIEKKYPFKSHGLLSDEWRRACRNKQYFFCPSKQDLKFRTKVWREYGKFVDRIIGNRKVRITSHKPDELEVLIDEIYNIFDYVENKKYIGKEIECILRIAIFYTLFLLCWGIVFDQLTIEEYWLEIGVKKPRERALFVANHFPQIFYRGPIANIARMTYQQCKGKYSRGVFFDALHSIYIDYSDAFITSDTHFKTLRDNDNGYDPNHLKIKHMDEIKWTAYPRDI